MSIAALKAGKHVMCTVPMATTIEECEQIVKLVKETGLKYMMAETSYYRPEIITCREWSAEKKFGTIIYSEAEYHHEGLLGLMHDDRGLPTWRHGFPPMWYPTHCTGMIVPVTGERLTEVQAIGWGDGHEILKTNRYQNPFWNTTGFFKTSGGHASRISVFWHVAAGGAERAQFHGDRRSFIMKTPEGAPNVYLLIPFDSIDQFAAMQEKLDADKKYQSAAEAYFHTTAKRPRFSRIESELMLSFQAFPRAVVPELRKQAKPRLFELRSYESHSERMGALKVEMFNSGEVPIFLDCGIQPVFMGRVISGPKMPNLTYMTVYADDEALKQAWGRFSDHPDWRTLKAVEKYKGTVSKIHKVLLSPRPYSAF
ncbi:MAG: NIPSNAP family protein [Planctomycetes bacterium]|nr:NIPSNAP family protein [Planctomycetota bacterium]